MASTFNSCAISGSDLCVSLYRVLEVREMTRRELPLANSVVSASVMASAKKFCAGSPDRFSSGRTATDRMDGVPPKLCHLPDAKKRRAEHASRAAAVAAKVR